jgi:hypothetical protein
MERFRSTTGPPTPKDSLFGIHNSWKIFNNKGNKPHSVTPLSSKEYQFRIMMLCLMVLFLSSIMETVAFVPLRITTRQVTILYGAIGDDDGDMGSDVENARQRLENLLSNPEDGTEENNSNGKGDNNDDNKVANTPPSFSFLKLLSDYEDGADFSVSSFPPPPPLSSIERDRRLCEIKLLECLVEDDDAVSELWNHWYSERGSAEKASLETIGEMFNTPEDWEDCERDLIEVVDEYGIYFVEPLNLLATLYFLQGRLELSYKLCQLILIVKPYHIGALSGIVQVALGLRDPIASREWALKRLPSRAPPELSNDGASINQREEVQQVENPRRVEWVERAVATAKELLDQADRRTKEDFFGKPETYYDNVNDNEAKTGDSSGFNSFDDESDGSAWQ